MPRVGGKMYKTVTAAKNASKRTGRKMVMTKASYGAKPKRRKR